MKTKLLLSVCLSMAGYGMVVAQSGAPYIEFYNRETYVEPIEPVGPLLLGENSGDDAARYPLRHNPFGDNISIYTTTWTRADILHSPTRDLLALAALSPSVSMRNGAVSVWGSEYALLILVDGVKIRGTAGIPQGAVYSMEVITAGVPACYGDTQAGVISITTFPALW